MKMTDGLAAVGAFIDDDAIALSLALEFRTDFGRRGEEAGLKLGRGLGIEFGEMVRVQDGNDQDVRGCLRAQVVKRDDVLVAHDLARRYLPAHDLTKDAVVGVAHVRGCMSSKYSTEIGLAITPAMSDFIANGTVVCTSGIAGTSSCTIFTARA